MGHSGPQFQETRWSADRAIPFKKKALNLQAILTGLNIFTGEIQLRVYFFFFSVPI